MQYAMTLIDHKIQGNPVQQRASDGYINATAMCRIAGKLWGHYRENANTQAFLSALESDIGIPISELVKSVKGVAPQLQGTLRGQSVALACYPLSQLRSGLRAIPERVQYHPSQFATLERFGRLARHWCSLMASHRQKRVNVFQPVQVVPDDLRTDV